MVDWLALSTKAIDTIPRVQHPTIVTERKSFFDLCHEFRWFVPKCARIAALLNHKLGKDMPFPSEILNVCEIEAQETLQHRMLFPQIIPLPKPI